MTIMKMERSYAMNHIELAPKCFKIYTESNFNIRGVFHKIKRTGPEKMMSTITNVPLIACLKDTHINEIGILRENNKLFFRCEEINKGKFLKYFDNCRILQINPRFDSTTFLGMYDKDGNIPATFTNTLKLIDFDSFEGDARRDCLNIIMPLLFKDPDNHNFPVILTLLYWNKFNSIVERKPINIKDITVAFHNDLDKINIDQ